MLERFKKLKNKFDQLYKADTYLFIYFYLLIMKIVHNSTTYKINIGINVEDEYIYK